MIFNDDWNPYFVFDSIGCKNTEQSVHPLDVGFYRSGRPKTTTQTPLDQIPRIGPPAEA